MQEVRLSFCDYGNAQTSNPVQTKEMEMAHMKPTPFAKSDK